MKLLETKVVVSETSERPFDLEVDSPDEDLLNDIAIEMDLGLRAVAANLMNKFPYINVEVVE